MDFKTQSEVWIKQISTRKRHPVRGSTLERYNSILRLYLLPKIGTLDLSQVGNKTVKELVANLHLSAASVQQAVVILKMVVKSAVDEEGNQTYPRTWNSTMIDAPSIEDQDAPIISLDTLQAAIGSSYGECKGLYALLAGSGLRVSEALSLTCGQDDQKSNFWDVSESLLHVRHSKTDAGVRLVDLDPELNAFLVSTIQPSQGLVFNPNIDTQRARLASLIGNGKFHSFRRFRVTHLDKSNTPSSLVRFWIGHSAGDISQRYMKVGNDIQARKEWAKKVGIGFEFSKLF